MASVSAPGFGVTGGSRRDVLSQALQGVRSQIKRLRKQAVNAQRSSKNTGVMTHHQQRVAAAVYVLSRHDVNLAGEKVLTYPCSKGFGTTQQQAERMVEDVFMSLPDGFSSSLDDPVDAATSRIVQEAKKFIAESGTDDWVEGQNLQQGVAPSSSAARRQYESLLRQDGVSVAQVHGRSARRWAQRWAQRWRAKRGKSRRQERVEPEAIRGKVSWNGLVCARFFVKFAVLFSGPFSGPSFNYHIRPRP